MDLRALRRRAVPIVAAIFAIAVTVGALSGCGASPPPRVNGLIAIWGKPSGGGKPRALVLLIHGGAWIGQSAQAVASEAGMARFLQEHGYETLTIDYRRGEQGIKDAEMFYRLARRRVGSRLPICAVGISAGAQISLMLAEKFPDLACVVDFAGPTNLTSLAPGTFGYQLAVRAFGAHNLATYSPALHARSIRAKVLLVYAQNDPLVPLAQGEQMARALPGARLIVLPPGPATFAHSRGGPGTNTGVATAPFYSSLTAAEALLANVAKTWHR